MRSGRTAAANLVGRAEEIASVRAALGGGGCVIAGPAGVGKSRLAAEAIGAEPAVRVLATESAAAVPYGAFAHLLPVSGRITDVIPAFIQMLGVEHKGAVPVVLVDDGHLLDPASAALVLALVTTGAARPLVTVRTPEPVPDAIAALWKEHGLERIDLQGLSGRDVGELVRSELDGPVDPRAIGRITDLSMGNPLYVHELLHDAKKTGALERGATGWRWHEALLAFDRLSDLIKGHVGTVGEPARRALEFLSVLERMPLAVLVDLTSEDAVEELEREGLVRVGADASAEVTVAHPLYGEVVAAGLAPILGMRIRRQAAAALQKVAAEPLQIARLLLDAGEANPRLFIQASGIALRRGGVRLALRLAMAAGESLDAGLAKAGALIALGRFDDVEPILAPFESAASHASLEVSAEYFGQRCRALLRGSRPDTTSQLVDRAQRWHIGREWEAVIAWVIGWTNFYAGRSEDALRCVEGFIDDERVSLGRRFYLWTLAYNVYGRLARYDDCRMEVERGKRLASGMAVPPSDVRIGLLLAELLLVTRVGPDPAATEARILAARAGAAAAGDWAMQAAVTLMLGSLSLQRGHAAEAVAYFDETANAYTEADAVNNAMYAATLRAQALASYGDAVRAQAQLVEIDQLSRVQPSNARKHAVDIEVARALVDAVGGRTSAGVDRLLAVVDAGHGNPGSEIVALYEALRLGADPKTVASRLEPLVAAAQDELACVFLAHAAALSRDDAAAQMSVARQFYERGCDLYAAEAASRAARSYADAGLKSSSREAASLAARYVLPCGPAFSWALSVRLEAPTLTAREREIAVLASRGLRNKEIAEDLDVSIRTVESHLLNACHKLGVDGRSELSAVIGQ